MRIIVRNIAKFRNFQACVRIAQEFSSFKTKFQPLKTNPYGSITEMYNDMSKFENSLEHL